MLSLCFCVSVAFLFPALLGATTVSGSVRDAAGNAIASGKVILRLSQEGTVSDPALLLIQPPVTCTITNGSIGAGCTVRGNDTISPAGTFYRVRLVSTAGQELLPERRYVISGASFDFGTATPLASDVVAAQAYQIIKDEGANLLQRQALNFTGPGVACSDNAAQSRTDCTISGGGGGSSQHQVDGLNLAANDPVNFQDSATIDFTNPSAGNVQAAVKDSSITAAKLSVAGPSGAQLSALDDDNIAAGALSATRITGTALIQADATTTPTANKIPQADGLGKLADGWLSSNVSLLGQSIGTAELEDNTATDAKVANTITLDNLTQVTTRNHGDLQGIGVNDHHAQVHALVGSDHTASALTAGQVVRATGATTFAWQALPIADTSGDLPASRVDDGGAASTQALFSGGAGAAGFRAIAAGDVPNVESLNGTLTTAKGGTGANNTATAGRYLRADGTNFLTSSVAAAGAGSCTNQFVRSANDNAAPTCASVGSADISSGAVGAAALADTYHTFIHSIVIFDPTTSDTNRVQHKFPSAVTLTRLSCSTNTGTASINFDERAEATPNTAGSNVLSAALVCDTDSQATNTFSDAAIAASAPLNLQITATSGTPGVVRIHLEFRAD
jgi:hypothetical protein